MDTVPGKARPEEDFSPGTTVDLAGQAENARAFALAYCTEHGDPEASGRLRIDTGDGRVIFSIVDAALCGSSFSGFLRPERQERTITTALSRIMRQRARDRAIARAGETGSPAWSMDIHVLAWAMLCNAGVNPLLIAEHGLSPAGRTTEFSRAVTTSPIHVTPEIRAGRIFIPAIGVNSSADMDTGIVFFESDSLDGGNGLLLMNRRVPDTVAAALCGQPLSTIVDHPLLDMTSDVVGEVHAARVFNTDAGLAIDLDDDRMTLAAPPPGVATDWLRFAWNP